jgi:hypothetical protein
MSEQLNRARLYATEAHSRINHLRKYTGQPYQVHLKAVAKRVASVCSDEQVIAAAWLHDVVEDTPATFQDIELEFGSRIRQLVYELTDVSRPGDGNRATRKRIDREHLQLASADGKTIKLADLIDNCADICRNDERFGRVFLAEMSELLPLLQGGDPRLYDKAVKLNGQWSEKLKVTAVAGPLNEPLPRRSMVAEVYGSERIHRTFVELFSALDIAEPLLSFDASKSNQSLLGKMSEARAEVAGVRKAGVVEQYLSTVHSGERESGDILLQDISQDQIVEQSANLSAVIGVLTKHQYCFVSVVGQVAAVICREDIQKPIVRMWLFGMVTMIEMFIQKKIKQQLATGFSLDGLSASRLQKAHTLQQERARRGQQCELEDCLQFSDKALLLLSNSENIVEFGFESRRQAKKVIKDLESLRNNLAHAQDFISHDWTQIVRMTHRIEQALLGE